MAGVVLATTARALEVLASRWATSLSRRGRYTALIASTRAWARSRSAISFRSLPIFRDAGAALGADMAVDMGLVIRRVLVKENSPARRPWWRDGGCQAHGEAGRQGQ